MRVSGLCALKRVGAQRFFDFDAEGDGVADGVADDGVEVGDGVGVGVTDGFGFGPCLSASATAAR
jgi:hypothetical protein